MKHMIHSVIFSGLFICCQISWSLHYHDGPLIPFRIAADRAKFPVRQSTALCTVSHIISGIHDRLCQILHLIFRNIDNRKCQSLGRLLSGLEHTRYSSAESSCQFGHCRAGFFIHFAKRFICCCHDQILQHFNIIRIHNLFCQLHL